MCTENNYPLRNTILPLTASLYVFCWVYGEYLKIYTCFMQMFLQEVWPDRYGIAFSRNGCENTKCKYAFKGLWSQFVTLYHIALFCLCSIMLYIYIYVSYNFHRDAFIFFFSSFIFINYFSFSTESGLAFFFLVTIYRSTT